MFFYSFFWYILAILPPALICVYPFWGHFKVSRKKLRFRVALFLVFVIGTATVLELFDFYASEELSWLWIVATAVTLLICFLFFYFTMKADIYKLLFVFLIVVSYDHYMNVAEIITYAQVHEYLDSLYPNLSLLASLCIKALLLCATAPFLLKFFRRYIKPIALDGDYPAWRIMWIIPSIFFLMSIIYDWASSEHLVNWQYTIFQLILMLGSFIVYYVAVNMLEQTVRNTKLAQQVALQGEHYKALQVQIAETRRAKHDLRHHISVFKSHVDTTDREVLKAYIDEYNDTIEDDAEIEYCDNFAINALVRHYTGIAKSEGISVDVCLDLPDDVGIGDTDLCIIFGNCIENAIEACQRDALNNTAGDKFIKVNSMLKGKILTIAVDNSFDGKVFKENEVFLSRKPKGNGKAIRESKDTENTQPLYEGLGISSVRIVAEKHGGTAKFEADGNVFKVTVILTVK